jgi:TolA-binding protein
MRFFYKLFFTFLFLLSSGLLKAEVSIEQQIASNERLIDKLQKQIDDLIRKQNLLVAKKNNLNTSSANSTQNFSNGNNSTSKSSIQEVTQQSFESATVSATPLPSEDEIKALKERILALEKKLDTSGGTLPDQTKKSPYENDISNEETLKANTDDSKASFLPEANSRALAQYEQANSLLQKNNKQDAKSASESFRYIIEAFPNDPIFKKAYVKFGRALLVAEDYEQAKNVLNKVLSEVLKSGTEDDLLIAESYLELLEAYRFLNDKVGYSDCLSKIKKLNIKFDSQQQAEFDRLKETKK